MFKQLIFFYFLLCFGLHINAQPPTNATQNRGANTARLNTGRVYGKIVNLANGKALSGAIVQAVGQSFDTITKKRKPKIIATITTEKNGDFVIENLPIMGPLALKVSVVGFKKFEQAITFGTAPKTGKPTPAEMAAMANNMDKDLGNLKLEANAEDPNTITVVANKPLFTMGSDRKIFNVEKSAVSTGGTAIDVMRNIPSVLVDIDGNVQLRNNTPQIFIDGRPTTLTLDQIPADAIATVELITNPSAKFDASGGNGGIINVVLKKNRKKGYNGNLRANLDSRGIPGVGADVNLRQDKINYFGSINAAGRKSISEGISSRTNLFTTPIKNITQQNDNVATGYFMNYRAGADYFIDNRNTLTVSGSYVQGQFKPTETSTTTNDSAIYTGGVASKFFRDGNTVNNFRNKGGSVAFKHLFAKQGQELTADITYNKINNKSDNAFISTFSNNAGAFLQNVNAKGAVQLVVGQLDFVQPLGKNEKFETGLRFQNRQVANENINKVNNIVIGALGFNYTNKDQVYAAYANYSKGFTKWNYNLGLRVESSTLEGRLLNTGQVFKNNFPISFFPSLALSYKINDKQDFQFNTSRRINRPSFFQLLPFVDYTDSLNISSGNPNLRPEFSNSIEVSYSIQLPKNNSLLLSVYGKFSTGLVSRYQYKAISPFNGQPVLINGWINANNSSTSGFEFTTRNPITTFWDATTNLNIFYATLKVTEGTTAIENSQTSFFVKHNSNFKLPNNYSIQAAFEYQGKTILPPGAGSGGGGGGRGGGFGGGGGFGQTPTSATQGFIRPNYGMDLGLRKDFGKAKNTSLTLNVNDIFKTKVNDIFSESPFFIQNYSRRRDWRVFRLNFNYKFGKQDVNLFKRKNNRSEGGGEG